MKSTQSSIRRAAFSLIELLVTFALMLVVFTMLYGFGSQSHQRTQKELCSDNLQKIYLALQVYGNDFRGYLPSNTNARTSEEVLNVLLPKYTADNSIFICPGGRDSEITPGKRLEKCTISYAYYMGRRILPVQATGREALMSDRQVDTEPKRAGEAVFSSNGKSPGNNHHKYGGNFLFNDGSVEHTPAHVPFTLGYTPSVALLNPKP